MRDLSASALTQIAEQYGNEPITILTIAWAPGSRKSYADRDISRTEGKILSISDLDNVVKISKNDDSQEISVVLDDTSGEIKAIMDEHDIHKRDVWVYQYFEGMDRSDKFLLFKGKINSPISWNEGEQTVSITVVSQIEDKEVGFSPEEGQFPHIPRDLIGQTWPSIFGTPLDVPAVQIGKAVTGTTLCSVGLVSGVQGHLDTPIGGIPPDTYVAGRRAAFAGSLAWFFEEGARDFWLQPEIAVSYSEKAKEYRDQREETLKQIYDVYEKYKQQKACAEAKRRETASNAVAKGSGCNPVRILGGEDFLRGTITLNIDGGLFTGYFEGDSDSFKITSRIHSKHSEVVAGDISQREEVPLACIPPPPPWVIYHWEADVPPNSIGAAIWDSKYHMKFWHRPKAQAKENTPNKNMKHFWAEAGASVVIEGDEPITYIVSIVPGTVLQVKAFKTFNSVKHLIEVPTDMWTAEVQEYGDITAVQVTIEKALSTLEDQNWSDDIHVTFESDIGPNIVDILTYLIQTYTDLDIDTPSFDTVKTKIDKFPANFALLDRKNILTVLQEIAFQARCNLRLVNGIFYLSYLAKEPDTVGTITLSDIENQSIEVFLTPTEDLVTKYTALWRLSYAQDDLNKIILRHNVRKYGIQEEDYEYYIYNQPDIIHKIATFWLIRKSNTWKRIKFKTFFQKLNLEAFDPVLLQLGSKDYVANSDVKAIIEQANIDGENYTISMECWLPVKSGEMEPYEFAWPANVDATWIFPTDREVDLGLDGGDGIGRNATGELPVGDVSGMGDQSIFVGGPNVIFGPQTDRGDRHPSDSGFTAQSLRIDSTLANITVETPPHLNLLLNYADDASIVVLPNILTAPFVIILEKTPVISDNLDDCVSTLSDVFGLVKEDEDARLVIRTDAKFRGGEDCQIAPFHFKYDSIGGVWGAGTAFLRENDELAPEDLPEDLPEDPCALNGNN